MDVFAPSFSVTITDLDRGRSLTLLEGRHFRLYPFGKNRRFGDCLSKRQIDLVRIAAAVHLSDSWIARSKKAGGHRRILIEIDVLDPLFWSRLDTLEKLADCVTFVSGGDEWSFRFRQSISKARERRADLFRDTDQSTIVPIYSGGLDSAAGLALRLASNPGRPFVPVTVRYQTQKGNLVAKQFKALVAHKLVAQHDLLSLEAAAFIRHKHVRQDFDLTLREIGHRCRPFLFMCVAGVVSDVVSCNQVEVYESGVGSLNLSLVGGPADHRTTRSTHPHFLRLLTRLISHVHESTTTYVLPFAAFTKAEMVRMLKDRDLEDVARGSVSCIRHPLRRKNGLQCGQCPACVYRRQAMFIAGISEDPDAYEVDLFSDANEIPEKAFETIRAFHQQIARLGELHRGRVPKPLRNYLYVTNAISSDEELFQHVEVYRRYVKEWELLIADARVRELPWIAPFQLHTRAKGAIA